MAKNNTVAIYKSLVTIETVLDKTKRFGVIPIMCSWPFLLLEALQCECDGFYDATHKLRDRYTMST